MYDIVIIGAGSSRCVAAKMLVEKGYKVLLVEKCKMPRYSTENRGMIFIDDKGKEYRFEQEGRMFGEVRMV